MPALLLQQRQRAFRRLHRAAQPRLDAPAFFQVVFQRLQVRTQHRLRHLDLLHGVAEAFQFLLQFHFPLARAHLAALQTLILGHQQRELQHGQLAVDFLVALRLL